VLEGGEVGVRFARFARCAAFSFSIAVNRRANSRCTRRKSWKNESQVRGISLAADASKTPVHPPSLAKASVSSSLLHGADESRMSVSNGAASRNNYGRADQSKSGTAIVSTPDHSIRFEKPALGRRESLGKARGRSPFEL